MDFNICLLCGCFFLVWEKNKYVLPGISSSMGTSLMPRRISQSLISSLTSAPAEMYSLSAKHRCGEDCTTIFRLEAFFWIHLHCAGVNATLLSAGILPSFINPI